MSRKDLTGKLSGEPQLAFYHRIAVKNIFGVTIRIPAKVYNRYVAFDKQLQKAGINPADYAYEICVILRSWVKRKGLQSVPINTFVGDWALTKYMKVYDSETVTIDRPKQDEQFELLHYELLVARSYIEANLIEYKKLRDVVIELKPILSKEWLKKYENEDRTILEIHALDILEDEYLVKYPTSYVEIIRKLVLNGHNKTR